MTGESDQLGPGGGRHSVTITGTNFTGATAVKFGATAATTFTVNSATLDHRDVAGGQRHGRRDGHDAGGTSATAAADQFTYVAAPTVTDRRPTSGPAAGGTSVTITGTNFTGATAVKFGATAATTFTVNSATSITATSPAGSGTVDITVTTPGGTSATSAADQFTYRRRADGDRRQPDQRPGGGRHFGDHHRHQLHRRDRGEVRRHRGHRRSPSTAPPRSPPPRRRARGTVDMTVTTTGGTSATSAADQFTYVAAPTVTRSAPDQRARRRAAPR